MRIFLNIMLAVFGLQIRAAELNLAATATNQLGIDLHRQLATGDENLCVSPYSIQSTLAMTFGPFFFSVA